MLDFCRCYGEPSEHSKWQTPYSSAARGSSGAEPCRFCLRIPPKLLVTIRRWMVVSDPKFSSSILRSGRSGNFLQILHTAPCYHFVRRTPLRAEYTQGSFSKETHFQIIGWRAWCHGRNYRHLRISRDPRGTLSSLRRCCKALSIRYLSWIFESSPVERAHL